MAKKRTTLPKDFGELLKKGDLQELIKVFDKCEISAHGGYGKQTALAFPECPHELAKWLVEQGLDIETPNTYHYTPLQYRSTYAIGNIESLLDLGANLHVNNRNGTALHCAARDHVVANVKLLIERGAVVDALAESSLFSYGPSGEAYTPLELTLFTCNNIDIENTLEISKILLQEGAKRTERMQELVSSIGKEFEYVRANFNKDYVEQTSNALDELYSLFEVNSAPKRILHDGTSPISVNETAWQKQHEQLWELLVPASGNAKTLQGEVIRISGRIARELLDNGGMNWDSDFKLMATGLNEFTQYGQQLSEEEASELTKIVNEVTRKNDSNINRLSELLVKWVLLNPTPIQLPQINYDR